MTRRRTAAALAVLVVALAGCGDDDPGDDAAGTTTTVTSVEAGVGDDGTEDDPADDTTTTSSTVADATAEDAPGSDGGDGEGAADDFVWVADLTGDTEVPGPGDPTGSGRFEMRSGEDGELCIDMAVTGLASEVTASHIHRGAAGAAGGVVVPIGEPSGGDGGTATWDDVCVAVDAAVADELAADASQFYANVHTAEHPDGAVRGQLTFATIFDLELP